MTKFRPYSVFFFFFDELGAEISPQFFFSFLENAQIIRKENLGSQNASFSAYRKMNHGIVFLKGVCSREVWS